MQRIGSRRFERWGSRSLVAVVVVVALVAVGIATPLAAGKDDRGKGAAIGAGVGLLTGGTRDAAKGALVGAGAGAMATKGEREKAQDYAKKGAAIGAGVGLLKGDGLEGAAKGAIYAGGGGGLELPSCLDPAPMTGQAKGQTGPRLWCSMRKGRQR
jgi:hypothetical protein